MSATSVVLDTARTLLDDENGINWPDNRLIPKLQTAFREMVAKLDRAGIPVILEQGAVMTVPAFSSDDSNQDLSTVSGYPTDMIAPIWVKERQVGQMNTDFVDMTRVDFLPDVTKTTYLIWWAWLSNPPTSPGFTIMVKGATNSVQLQIRYKRNLTAPITVNDDVIVPLCETFLAPRTAQYACLAIRDFDRYNIFMNQADMALDDVLASNVKELQDLPAKRRSYHRGRGRTRYIREM